MLPTFSPFSPVPGPAQPRVGLGWHVSKFPPGTAPNVTITRTCFGTSPDHFGPNHKLLPAPLGDAQCQFQEFTDSSYQAQIAVSDANCAAAETLGIGAFQARRTPYNGDGFACKATPEGAGSEWAKAWDGTYYAYDCKSGAEQVAFNWGAHCTY